MLSNQLFKSKLRRSLLDAGQEYGTFTPMLGREKISFDITEIYPSSIADFGEHRCRIVLQGAIFSDCQSLSKMATIGNQITCWASDSIYASCLAEYLFNLLSGWNRGEANPSRSPVFDMPGQVLQSLSPSFPVSVNFHSSNGCFFSSLQITAILSF